MSVIIQRLSLPVIVTQMEQLVARKRGESVLMFVLFCSGLFWVFLGRNWGNKLDRDFANQNSLQKLSDPGGSRALDKQGWLFQRHAYITYIWAWDVTCRRQRQTKPGSHPKCFVRKVRADQWNVFFDKWVCVERHRSQSARASLRDKTWRRTHLGCVPWISCWG